MESQFVEDEALWIQTEKTGEKGDNILSDPWIALKVSYYFSEAIFLVLPMESQFVEEEALWIQTAITGEKDDNIWSDRWIALKVSH